MKCKIVYSQVAKDDIMDIANYISITCKAPKTSKEYMKKLFNKIKSLTYSPDSYPLYNRKLSIQYGFIVRRIIYKKMTIIYTIHGNVVLIQRILSGSLITETE
jgi:plasmid stabilization system protein ParE